MNASVAERSVKARSKLGFVDCDIHPVERSAADFYPYLSTRWREHMETFGSHICQGLSNQLSYPRMMASGRRADAFPKRGGPPGSDIELMKEQHLDANNVEIGMLVALSRGGMEERNLDFAAALSSAVNDWQLHEWVEKDRRLQAGVVVPQEYAEFAAQEIDRRAQNEAFRQVIISPKSSEPLGRRKYWPIYEAAARNNLVLGLHPAAISGGNPSSGTGWGTYYMQEHYTFGTTTQGNVISLIIEGVFERFPKLKVALIESGFTWAPALGWRMDKQWERMRKETPHLKRRPSEYLREHFWFCTQPMEEPESPEHLTEMIDWVGWDRIMFSSDYPHWDFDDPKYALTFRMTEAQRAGVLRGNAKALYRLA
jgi:predicted TIM-barrel fold metal-dependent hydrolase